MDELDVTLQSLDEWLEWSRSNPRVFDAAASQRLGERIVQNGFTEPLTGLPARPEEIQNTTGNLREGLDAYGRNSRTRAVLRLIEEKTSHLYPHQARIYAPEAVTSMALCLRGIFSKFLGSEYASTQEARDAMYPIPHEDLTALTLPSNTFEVVTTNEVLEHVPDLDAALREIARVLVPGGWHVGTHPFLFMQEEGDVRAALRDGSLVHFKDPEYHGNPFEANGSLVFELPGWNILSRARSAGFRQAHMRFLASVKHGYLTENMGVFVFCCQK